MATPRSGKGSVRDVAISLDRGCLLSGGREIRLRAKTFQVLVYLHERHGRLVSKEDLLRDVWPATFVSDDSLTKCVREIRHALDDADHQLLKTVARRGFILDAILSTAPRPGDGHHPAPRWRLVRQTHNLPAPLTSFIGRQQAIAELAHGLSSTRLLTLTGAGGCGKTRLALEVARRALDGFPGGAWLADLAPLADGSLVVQTVATALDIRQATGRSLIESMADQLRDRRVLLLLDNCEHVIAEAAELAGTLLQAAPGVTILATSREALGVEGETNWRVPSLTMPDAGRVPPLDDLRQFEAVRLLVERAAAAGSTFTITSENAGTVAEACRRLDGIPLAIELAAARLTVLSIQQINARLDDRFRLLTATPRVPVGRQRTLEATVEWSYDLLSNPERRLLGRLSAFAGGWTLESAEEVCGADEIARADVLDLMTRLVDKSLVMVEDDAGRGRRYRLLETVRHYARRRLQQSGEEASVLARHFESFLALARDAEPQLTGAEQLRWLDRLQLEHDNLRAALEWRLASDDPGADGLELAAALYWFWTKRAYFAEGRSFLERALAAPMHAAPARRAQALLALGGILFFQGEFDRSRDLLEESAARAGEAGEPAIVAVALGLNTMAAMERSDGATAARCAAQSRAAAQAAGMPWLESFSLTYDAYEALAAGDVDRAGELHERGLSMCRAQGELWAIGIILCDLALLRVVQRRFAEARDLCAEGIAIGGQFGDHRAVAWCLGVLAGADAAEGHSLRAARLQGAMEGLLDAIGSSVQPTHASLIGDRLFPAVQSALGTEGYRLAMAAGRAMSLAQAIQYAVGG